MGSGGATGGREARRGGGATGGGGATRTAGSGAGEGGAGAEAPIRGVSLVQYAAVKAAVAEGFALEEVLAVEGLKPRAFAAADLGWKQRVVAAPEVLAAYEVALAEAEDWLERPVEPLGDEVEAWASFLGSLGGAAGGPGGAELLAAHGLGLNDVSRLRRRWARRTEKDAMLGERLGELRARPGALGSLRVGPRVLRASRVVGGRPSEEGRAGAPGAMGAAGAASVEEALGLGLAEYAALCVELEALPGQRERVLRRHRVENEAAKAALDARWQAAFARDPTLATDCARLRAHHERRVAALVARAQEAEAGRAEAGRAEAGRAEGGAGEGGSGTMPGGRAFGAPALERGPGRGSRFVAPVALQVTAPLVDVPRGAALPFAKVEGEVVTAKAAAPKVLRAAESLTGTTPSLDIPRGPALPFAEAGTPAKTAGVHGALAQTAPTLDVPRGPALPFIREAAGPVSASASAVSRPAPGSTVPPSSSSSLSSSSSSAGLPSAAPTVRPAPRSALAETSLQVAIPRGLLEKAALPFRPGVGESGASAVPMPDQERKQVKEASGATPTPAAAQESKRGQEARPPVSAPTPSAGQEGRRVEGAPPLREPVEKVLSLAHYAALCVELAVTPEVRAAIFERYGLGDPAKRAAVDAAWKERLRSNPAEYGQWQEMYGRWYELRRQQGQQRKP